MKKKQNNNNVRRITAGGLRPTPGQTAPKTIVLTQPKRFGIDIQTVISSITSAENVDFNRRTRLYDMYSDILMDAHLTAIINKRKSAVLCTPIEFSRNGVPDEKIGEIIHSPWFSRFIADALDAIFWGFSLCQFYKNGDWPDYFLVPRKHVDPVRELILRNQTDITGTAWDEYDDMIFIGGRTDLGLLFQAAPHVIYKRNTIADWAQFSEIFGMPVREYLYDANDPDSRTQILNDAYNEGGAGVYVHSKESSLNFIESNGKTASAELYDKLTERCNAEMSKLVLGNTLTTEAGDKGTQALGTVHKKVEDKVTQSDRKFILNILNYDMTDVFAKLGINTEGGEFMFKEPKEIDVNQRMEIAAKLIEFGLPLDEEQLYEESGFRRPANYDKMKEELKNRKAPAPIDKEKGKEKDDEGDNTEPTDKEKRTFTNLLSSFFGHAPKPGEGALGW